MSDKKQERLIIILEESVFRSLIKDVFTFALFAGLMWFNHEYLAGSTFIDFLFIVIVILLLVGKSSRNVYKGEIKGAIEFLQDKARPNQS